MRTDIAELWAQELESGRKRQGKGSLRIVPKDGGEDAYCCLGVLTEMAVVAGVIPAGKINGHDRNKNPRYGYGVDLGTTTLCPKVREWAGMNNGWGGWPGDRGLSLATLNDESHDFSGIAEVIRENVERL